MSVAGPIWQSFESSFAQSVPVVDDLGERRGESYSWFIVSRPVFEFLSNHLLESRAIDSYIC